MWSAAECGEYECTEYNWVSSEQEKSDHRWEQFLKMEDLSKLDEEMLKTEERELRKLLPASATLHNCILLSLSKVSTSFQWKETFLSRMELSGSFLSSAACLSAKTPRVRWALTCSSSPKASGGWWPPATLPHPTHPLQEACCARWAKTNFTRVSD